MTKVCIDCGLKKPLSDFYIKKSGRDAGQIVGYCKSCNTKRCMRYQRNNAEKVKKAKRNWQIKNRSYISRLQKERDHKNGKSLPMSEAKDCPLYLGVFIAERVLQDFFDNVICMPPQNPGYDFVCGRGFKIDAKASCLIEKSHGTPRWQFGIRKNQMADYFLCLAFTNRESLTPAHVWLIPAKDVSDKEQISVCENTAKKWSMYEKPLDRILESCEQLKKRAP